MGYLRSRRHAALSVQVRSLCIIKPDPSTCCAFFVLAAQLKWAKTLTGLCQMTNSMFMLGIYTDENRPDRLM
jgi:hypothetical protein